MGSQQKHLWVMTAQDEGLWLSVTSDLTSLQLHMILLSQAQESLLQWKLPP